MTDKEQLRSQGLTNLSNHGSLMVKFTPCSPEFLKGREDTKVKAREIFYKQKSQPKVSPMKELIDLLCSRDPRSPFFSEDSKGDTSKCFCDNCFYGRHPLACQIITLQAKASMDQELIHHLEEVVQKLTKQNNEKDKLIKLYEQD